MSGGLKSDREIIVACVLWVGDFRKRDYTFEWVRRLRSMVKRHLPLPHRFVCLVNDAAAIQASPSDGIELAPLVYNWRGWWSKIELFRPGLFPPSSRVLYLDLDLVVMDDLTPLVDISSPFALMKAKGSRSNRKTRDGWVIHRFNSSVMSFSPPVGELLFHSCYQRPEVRKMYRGDQDLIGQFYPFVNTFPSDWIIKLRDCPNGNPPASAKIVLCMPGKNVRAAKRYKWVRDAWK